MTVEAIDSGDPRLSSQATIIVNILDENDNPPIFKRRKYQGFMNSDLSDFRNDLQVSFQNINEKTFTELIPNYLLIRLRLMMMTKKTPKTVK